jgi:hypothetical protein
MPDPAHSHAPQLPVNPSIEFGVDGPTQRDLSSADTLRHSQGEKLSIATSEIRQQGPERVPSSAIPDNDAIPECRTLVTHIENSHQNGKSC